MTAKQLSQYVPYGKQKTICEELGIEDKKDVFRGQTIKFYTRAEARDILLASGYETITKTILAKNYINLEDYKNGK